MKSALAITWFEHRRMTGLCAGLGIPLHELVSRRRGLRRYAELIPRTFGLIRSQRPEVLLVQNPSFVLAVLALLLRPLFGYRLVVDAHNEAVEPYINRKWWFVSLARRLMRWSDLTIVTNRWLADIVTGVGGRAFVLPDPLPAVPEPESGKPPVAWRGAPLRMVAIATYAPDEPIEIMLQAARQLVGQVEFAFTGNHSKVPAELMREVPENVHFTGFLAEEDYWRLLIDADAVMDLTLMDNCLVCGAYEALACGKPAVLSGNSASKELFAGAAVFVDNSVAEIVTAVRALTSGSSAVAPDLAPLAARLRSQWSEQAASLAAVLKGESRELGTAVRIRT